MTATPLVELTVIEQGGVEVLVLDAPGTQVAVGPAISTATPQPLGTAAAGTTGQAADAGHIHAHGNLAGSSLHALASTSAAGFMSAAQFDLLAAATDEDTASTLVRRDASGDFEANIITAALNGNAATATKLATARTINGQSFDGTGNITITANPNSHTHGNISNDGKIGSTSGLPIVTGAAGVLQAGSFGTTAGTFAAGDDARFSGPRDPNVGSVTNDSVASNAAIALGKLATGALPSGITVASANLVDGTIVNDDINASAAIAGTKIIPDFGNQNVVTSGTLIGGTLQTTGQSVRTQALVETALPIVLDATTVPGATVLGTDGRVYTSLLGDGSYTWQRIISETTDGRILLNLTQSALGASLVLSGTDNLVGGAARPGRIAIMPSQEPASSIAVATPLGRLEFVSRDTITAGSNVGRPARIQADAVVGWSSFSKPTDLLLFAANVNTDPLITDPMPTLRYRIRYDGSHDFYGASNNLRLRITSDGNVLINNTTGTERLSVTGSIQLTNTADSYKVGTDNVVGSRKAGWAAPTGTATRTTFNTTTVTTAQLAERVKALIDDLTSHGLIGA